MSNTSEIPQWVKNRILAFFNRAKNVDDILDGTIKDDPSNGKGRVMGRKLAARILRKRSEIHPFRRFMEWEQFDEVYGVGDDTIRDLAFTFGISAAEAFRRRMYEDKVIYEANWPLEYFRTEFDDKEAFRQIVTDEEAFRGWVAEKVSTICEEREVAADQKAQMLADIAGAYVDAFHNGTPVAGYALALWFYEFDADNWFSWERIQEACISYFDHYSGAFPWEMELRFFRGFVQRGIIPPGITPEDLVVVVNWPEQAVTIWVSALYD